MPPESLSRAAGVVAVGWLQQQTWTAEDDSAQQAIEVVAEMLPGSRCLSRWTVGMVNSPDHRSSTGRGDRA
jgi:hypothetical protein